MNYAMLTQRNGCQDDFTVRRGGILLCHFFVNWGQQKLLFYVIRDNGGKGKGGQKKGDVFSRFMRPGMCAHFHGSGRHDRIASMGRACKSRCLAVYFPVS